jgi:hypothetical protein
MIEALPSKIGSKRPHSPLAKMLIEISIEVFDASR